MNDSEFQDLLEESWRRPLTEEEQMQLNAWLATRPEARAAWEEDAALNRSLQNLPDAPLSSNFTALVMQAVQREALPTPRAHSAIRLWWRRLSWAAACAAVLSAAWIGIHQHELRARREVATGLAVLANVTTLSDPAVLSDFDAIQRLSLTSGDDEELYAVLNN